MRLAPYVGPSLFLCGLLSGPSAFAHDFTRKLKDAPATIKFISPAEGQIVSPFSLDISWNRIRPRRGNLGLVIENVETGKRIFLGDGNSILGDHHALNHYSLSHNHKTVGYGFGRFKIIGYHYGRNADSYTYAGIGPEFIVAPREETFWTNWGEPEHLCPKISGTQNYRIEDIKEITCEEYNCVSPKFYQLSGTSVYLKDSPSWLEDGDNHIIKVTCLTASDSAQDQNIIPTNIVSEKAIIAKPNKHMRIIVRWNNMGLFFESYSYRPFSFRPASSPDLKLL